MFDQIENSFDVARYHSWVVQNPLPKELIATAEFEGLNMAFQHSKLPIYGVQFHPESILTPEGRTMIENWIESVRNRTSELKQLRENTSR